MFEPTKQMVLEDIRLGLHTSAHDLAPVYEVFPQKIQSIINQLVKDGLIYKIADKPSRYKAVGE